MKYYKDDYGCPVCGSSTKSFRKKMLRDNIDILDNQIIMNALSISEIVFSLRICMCCFHFYRHPLYDELHVVHYYQNKENFFNSKHDYKMTNKFGSSIEDCEIRLNYLKQITCFLKEVNFEIGNIKILDWGGERYQFTYSFINS